MKLMNIFTCYEIPQNSKVIRGFYVPQENIKKCQAYPQFHFQMKYK